LRKYKLTYKPYGEHAILIEWTSEISETILEDIITFKNKIERALKLQDIIVGYNSLLLVYTFEVENIESKIEFLEKLYFQKSVFQRQKKMHWEIPVCYDSQFGIDLESISNNNKISIEEIIKLHTQPMYTVYFIGFLPGFLYLAGLNEQIAIPRKSTPRLRVPKGSVAIGGIQTGIYPNESSGGWNIIGSSPISFFDATKESPCFAKSGDTISFKSISIDEYSILKNQNTSEK
jgi:inhibitor of KinA